MLSIIRQSRGFTQDALADAIGAPIETLKRIECGEDKPTFAEARRISNVLQYPIDYIFRGDYCEIINGERSGIDFKSE